MLRVTGEQFVQRDVIIHRSEKGYGIQIRGKNPIFLITSVKEGSVAAAAGINAGDRIMKVTIHID